ncbi:type I-E CRISPR-associated protein Cas6/Cse3/CasE [Insolitispirillum peregrinum]|uniref:CRISPR-associated protein, Cse3 family n=1 Tax=Insolitispirillum peregrinum TaxID=80876 RepID=A0A1N7MFQ7_9PROT|nr:type I-E CRISPR-associated protein Cas6/Cse3/CasE [Insolitispirillum peregrinum]SIS84954.1 CRISPR-associated protein, Cse3 family [Insolitispirillum peregrinum]
MSMIAAVLRLDRAAVQALRITDPYSLHRVIYSLFPDVRDDAAKQGSTPSGILFADKGGDARGRKILILSDRSPQPEKLGEWGELDSKPVPAGFLNHSRYRFEVVINPTRRDSASRKLVPVRQRHDIAEWFCQAAARSWGFAADADGLTVSTADVLQFRGKGQQPVTIARATVQGTLTVTDADLFQQSFQRGIGRGRAFGCGLLQLVPLANDLFS